MWATARLIATVGCENVHLRCDATDLAYVEKSDSSAKQSDKDQLLQGLSKQAKATLMEVWTWNQPRSAWNSPAAHATREIEVVRKCPGVSLLDIHDKHVRRHTAQPLEP